MGEHMTAEQLRAEIEAKCSEFMGRAIAAQNAPGWNADESCRDAYVEAVKYLRYLAARLSGMAADRDGTEGWYGLHNDGRETMHD